MPGRPVGDGPDAKAMVRNGFAAVCTLLLAAVPACSTRVVGGYFERDGKEYWTGGIDSTPHEVVGAEPGTFHPLDRDYARDNSRAYFDGYQMRGADASSLETLTGAYARDRYRAYFRGTPLIDADNSSFSVLDGGFAKDRSRVWKGDRQISADPAHFELLDHAGGAKDSTAVYCPPDATVVSKDPAHFVILPGSGSDVQAFTKDSQSVYYMCKPIPGADVPTFAPLADVYGYARDAHRAYWLSTPIAGADPNTLRVLNNDAHCAADQHHAYHMDSVIPNADPTKFPAGKAVTGCSDTGITFAG